MENHINGLRVMRHLFGLAGVILSSNIFPVNELDNPVGFSNIQPRLDASYDFIIGEKKVSK